MNDAQIQQSIVLEPEGWSVPSKGGSKARSDFWNGQPPSCKIYDGIGLVLVFCAS